MKGTKSLFRHGPTMGGSDEPPVDQADSAEDNGACRQGFAAGSGQGVGDPGSRGDQAPEVTSGHRTPLRIRTIKTIV